MEKLGLNEIRERFLSFFESKGHLRLKSFPLLPQNDNSLLLINSGMAPLKPYFTGEKVPPRKRVTTCQKCIRTPDIERVGKTARHGTFFEMLGNFSFGDYFKEEIIPWAWEFCTEVMKMEPEKIWITVYEDDDEARDIWIKKTGVDPSHIVYMGKEDNFWEIGSGPCGPCSELYYDRGPEHGCGRPDCSVGCECDRYVEFWNLVFTQFDGDGEGHYERLAHPNIDTGMGLERLACISQGVDNLFEVDTVRNIMRHIIKIAGVEYKQDPETDVSLRVITDHIRSTTFMVSDGILPSNEGRGYVLRRLLRRAARHGRLLGIKENFLYDVCDTVIKESCSAYPELEEKRDYIKKVIKIEEEKFAATIDSGLSKLEGYIAAVKEKGEKELPAEDAFRLHDTYGFPLDLTVEILSENGLSVSVEGFNRLMTEQKNKSRAAREGLDLGWSDNSEIDLSAFPATEFLGYEGLKADSKVLALVRDGDIVDAVRDGENALIVLDRTPFYGEGGGQVGDTGVITGPNGSVKVLDTKKNEYGVFMHIGAVSGEIRTGDAVSAEVDRARRASIARAHSSTHLLQKALRTVLGTHVQQAGSLVTPDRLRFDFTHFAPMTKEEIKKVEELVNTAILEGYEVNTQLMGIEEARQTGAMALFGEKYGDVVRVVRMGDYSTELCGGTHLDNTAKAGSLRIVSESSIAAGVRRIEAVTGLNVLGESEQMQEKLDAVCETLHTTPADMLRRAEQINAELKERGRQIEKLNARIAGYELDSILASGRKVGPVSLVTAKLGAGIDADMLRQMGERIAASEKSTVAILAIENDGKLNILCACGSDARAAGAHAGNIVRETAKLCGGGGGGRPDIAMAGAKQADRLPQALEAAEGIVASMLK